MWNLYSEFLSSWCCSWISHRWPKHIIRIVGFKPIYYSQTQLQFHTPLYLKYRMFSKYAWEPYICKNLKNIRRNKVILY